MTRKKHKRFQNKRSFNTYKSDAKTCSTCGIEIQKHSIKHHVSHQSRLYYYLNGKKMNNQN